MRTFHLTWLAFFICFFGWFSHAPLVPATIGPELGLSREQILGAFIGSVGITVFARVLIGWACDAWGPRLAYTGLLVFGAFAVGSSALATTWPTYLASRLAIGVIGASFVITQYHTTVMFAPNVVGIANATTAGWGNVGGGVTQAVMPMVAAAMLSMGFATSELAKWRPAMLFPAVAMLVIAYLYFRYTTDCPEGNYSDLPEKRPTASQAGPHPFWEACADRRVWLLFFVYAGCFGLELFVNGRAASYYQHRFGLAETSAGFIAALFGLVNVFARSLGGWFGDRFAAKSGLSGRVRWLVLTMVAEGVALLVFSRMGMLTAAVATMILFSTCVQLAEGATFSVVPFINKRALGPVAGIVGAGGNVGAVLCAQFMMQTGLPLQDCFLYFGLLAIAIGGAALGVKFSPEVEREAHAEYQAALSGMGGAPS